MSDRKNIPRDIAVDEQFCIGPVNGVNDNIQKHDKNRNDEKIIPVQPRNRFAFIVKQLSFIKVDFH